MENVKKQVWKPGTMLNPVPVIMASCRGGDGTENIVTAAWTGVACSEPPMVYISLRPERFSYGLIRESGEYVINLVTEELTAAADYCGVKSGRDVDKWAKTGLTKGKAATLSAPLINESPVNIECRLRQIIPLGSHDMFLAEVTAVDADERYMDENGRFDLDSCHLAAYSHGEYLSLGRILGKFGYSVKKGAEIFK